MYNNHTTKTKKAGLIFSDEVLNEFILGKHWTPPTKKKERKKVRSLKRKKQRFSRTLSFRTTPRSVVPALEFWMNKTSTTIPQIKFSF